LLVGHLSRLLAWLLAVLRLAELSAILLLSTLVRLLGGARLLLLLLPPE
jgi:hypothetical protein